MPTSEVEPTRRGSGREDNRLADQKSPYLRQHASNPVDWYPWGEAAFEKALREDKPLFISIGYSTCRWCHVMARESFENEEVAELLNDNFVSIKVDREERPDVDRIYMRACQAYTGRGGWPLNVITTPDGQPFFATTYLPPEPRRGSTGLKDVLSRISQLWDTSRSRVEETAEKLARAIREDSGGTRQDLPGQEPLRKACHGLRQRYDGQHGGFGRAPKFPSPHTLMFLLRASNRFGESAERDIVEHTLTAMRRGGVYDHVGLGFHRYSTDRQWKVPHFEKMLYDQAMLAQAYTEGYLAIGEESFRRTAGEILTYLMRDMRSPRGGFYAAQDAESEGEEGKYYVWTREEWMEVLGEDEGRLWADVFNIEDEGNFRDEATGERTGANIPHLEMGWEQAAREHDMSPEQLSEQWEEARSILLEARKKRVAPAKDTKQIAGWNGLAVAAFALAGRATGKGEYTDAARSAADFVLQELRTEDGRLLRYYREGPGEPRGYADDYSYVIWGLCELYEATFELDYLEAALELTDDMLELFWDAENGGLYLAGEDAGDRIPRTKNGQDGALPSANSVAAVNLLRLAELTTQKELGDRALDLIKNRGGQLDSYPAAFTHLLSAVDYAIGPTRQVVVEGALDREETRRFIRRINERFLPRCSVLHCPPNGEQKRMAAVCGWAPEHKGEGAAPRAYLCEDKLCREPIQDPDELARQLDEFD